MILYFSGTGNSRHIAEILANTLGDSITDATPLIKSDTCPAFDSDTPYVFVAPTYAWQMPRIFRDWIRRCTFGGNPAAYFVLTCGGEIGAAGNYIETFATDNGFAYKGTAQVVMPENYLIMFKPTPAERDADILAAAKAHTEELCKKIQNGAPFDTVKIPLLGCLESGIVNTCFYTYYISAKKFYATDACISCGKCVEHCVTNNITLRDGKPAWGDNCTHCVACICRCPVEAIEYGKNTKGKRRYVYGG